MYKITMRVDKYIWCIRLFKTRSLSIKVCKSNHVTVNGEVVKPAREIKKGDEISVRKNAIWLSVQVLDIPKGRLGAKLVADYAKDITSSAELEKLRAIQAKTRYERPRGLGRPTKKDRRELEEFIDHWSEWDEEDS